MIDYEESTVKSWISILDSDLKIRFRNNKFYKPKGMAKIVQINAIVFWNFVRQIAEQRNIHFANASL